MPFVASGLSNHDLATGLGAASPPDTAVWQGGPPWPGERAVLATMHGKETAIAPIVSRFLGLTLEVAAKLDTDVFGTFSREVERKGTPLDASRAKIAAGLDHAPDARFGLASEGSFVAHPFMPFLPLGREIVVLIDRLTGLELVGHFADPKTNFAHQIVTTTEAARLFATLVGFPAQGLIVSACVDGAPLQVVPPFKDIASWQALDQAITRMVRRSGEALVETDMRAHRNGVRMRAIRHATLDLVRRSRSRCPECARPGFSVTERLPGLPCEDCGEPTIKIRAECLACIGCGPRQERPVPASTADPGSCGDCNP